VTEALESILSQVQQLSPADRSKLLAYLRAEESLRELKPNPVPSRRPDGLDLVRESERRWLDEHRNEYAGQWVALDGDRLIAHGPDGREVYRQVKEAGVKYPFVVHLPPADALPFGGW
jgi:hypothetical protein